ncbi:MAG TPA: hypothetical protein VGQ83_28655 [Polyangia bacterium]|jgi:hypothetical protein
MLARLALLTLLALAAAACGGATGAAQKDAGPPDDAALQQDDAALPQDAAAPADDGGWGPPPTGYHVFFDLGTAMMMSQVTAFGIAGFWPTAREDLLPEDPPAGELDTCAIAAPAKGAQCAGPEDCAPEQQCLPEKSSSGQPIAGTETCVTARALMDVGPFTMDGFTGGPQTFAYNAGQHGAYTTASPGDGSLDPSLLAFDADYTFTGPGDPAQGIGAFQGQLHVPVDLQLTAPALVQLPIGFPGLEVDTTQDLTLQWTGTSADEEVTITLTGGPPNGKSILCRARDDGELTIPADMLQQANLAAMAFFNTLTFERRRSGTGSGEGITFVRVGVTQMIMYNVRKL